MQQGVAHAVAGVCDSLPVLHLHSAMIPAIKCVDWFLGINIAAAGALYHYLIFMVSFKGSAKEPCV